MQITWHGQYTVKIQTGDTSVLLDPYSPEVGLPLLKIKTEIIALTNPKDLDMSYQGNAGSENILIDTPGEYSVNGLGLYAMSWFAEDGTERSIQRWMVEGMIILNPGALNRLLTDEELQELQKTNIDILLLPVGGGSGLDTKNAIKLLTTIEPRVVIPIHYKLPKVKEDLESIDHFAKEMGIDASKTEKKLNIKANKLPESEMETIILSP